MSFVTSTWLFKFDEDEEDEDETDEDEEVPKLSIIITTGWRGW